MFNEESLNPDDKEISENPIAWNIHIVEADAFGRPITNGTDVP